MIAAAEPKNINTSVYLRANSGTIRRVASFDPAGVRFDLRRLISEIQREEIY